MKTITRITSTVVIAIVIITSVSCFAQNHSSLTKKEKKELKIKKKEKKSLESLKSRKHYAYLLKNKAFVLEANQLYGPRGNMISVSPTTSFFAVRKDKVIFQFGLGAGGRNGVGGMTAEGFISDYKFNPGKNSKKALMVSGKIMPKGSGPRGYFTITVNNDGNAYLHVDMPVNGRLSMSGRIVALPNARVFKGQSDF
ncbi:MAG: DUF4251 domain-containing protein [Bacteroidales bacterium]|nr:DUF4251 domain-containing protein [Bacteroidales bacterium]